MFVTMRAVWLTVLGLLPVVVWPSTLTICVWFALVLVLVVVDVLLAPRVRDLAVSRRATASVRCGETTTTTLEVTNEGSRRVRGQIRDTWQPLAGAASEPTRLRLDAGAGVEISTELTPSRRGTVTAHRVALRTMGPLGFGGRQGARVGDGAITVLPAFPSRRVLPSRLVLLRELDGRSAVRTRGHGTEFDSLREYVRGDDVRSIDWRASARSQDLVVRTWQPERDRRIILALDTGRLSAARVGDVPRLDAAMDAVLLLAAVAARAGDRVGFVGLDTAVHSRVWPDARRIVGDLSTTMAPIEPRLVVTDWTGLAGELQRNALVVLLTPIDAEATEAELLPFVARIAHRHRVVVASVADPDLAELATVGQLTEHAAQAGEDPAVARFHARAAAEHVRLRSERIADALVRAGATVLDQPPDRLPTALVDHYLLLKSQGLL